MTDDELTAIEARAENFTAKIFPLDGGTIRIEVPGAIVRFGETILEILAAPETSDVPALVAEVRMLREALERSKT